MIDSYLTIRTQSSGLYKSKGSKFLSFAHPVKDTEEVKNLIDGVGEGFVEGDYYAPDRYYSKIPGVKNIRIKRGFTTPATIFVKLYFYVPLPKKITLFGEEYQVETFESSKYSDKLYY